VRSSCPLRGTLHRAVLRVLLSHPLKLKTRRIHVKDWRQCHGYGYDRREYFPSSDFILGYADFRKFVSADLQCGRFRYCRPVYRQRGPGGSGNCQPGYEYYNPGDFRHLHRCICPDEQFFRREKRGYGEEGDGHHSSVRRVFFPGRRVFGDAHHHASFAGPLCARGNSGDCVYIPSDYIFGGACRNGCVQNNLSRLNGAVLSTGMGAYDNCVSGL